MSEHIPSDPGFAVGEIAIAQNCACAENNGKEVEILALPMAHDWINPLGLRVFAGRYWVRGPLHTAQLKPHHLRKRGARWSDCVWQPESINV